jgi:hypothetical protein
MAVLQSRMRFLHGDNFFILAEHSVYGYLCQMTVRGLNSLLVCVFKSGGLQIKTAKKKPDVAPSGPPIAGYMLPASCITWRGKSNKLDCLCWRLADAGRLYCCYVGHGKFRIPPSARRQQ